MNEPNDIALLKQYAGENSEAAFAALAGRHVNLVYSTALRSAGNADAAEEITQAVFIILARKAKSLSGKTILTGWLYQTTRLTAANHQRTETRRRNREQEAFMQTALNEPEPEAWTQIAPLLDDAISKLGEKERNAILLRFFENKSAREMAAALRVGEPAAQKRVTRAVGKLRAFFAKRGVTLSAAAIAGAVAANSVHAAPAGLAAMVTAAAAKGAAVSGSTLILVKGALKLMAWAKMQTAVVAGAVVLFAAGAATVTVNEIQKHDNNQWDNGEVSPLVLETGPHIVKIIPSKFPNAGGWASLGNGRERIYGVAHTAKELVQTVYGSESTRTIFLTTLPPGEFDFIANLTSGSSEAIKQLIRRKFGVTGRFAMVETNALLLEVQNPNANGLKLDATRDSFQGNGTGQWSCTNQPLSLLAEMAEAQFRIPVVDGTGLTNRYDFSVTWDQYGKKVGNQYPNYPNLEGLKQALLDQLGLELVPTNMPVEMLIVEKVTN